MLHPPSSILFRINWCRLQGTRACTESEVEGWRAEEEGLRDALLTRDHTKGYRYDGSSVFERYALGFEDGRALIRISYVDRHFATRRP
jgi:hypothetical protein